MDWTCWYVYVYSVDIGMCSIHIVCKHLYEIHICMTNICVKTCMYMYITYVCTWSGHAGIYIYIYIVYVNIYVFTHTHIIHVRIYTNTHTYTYLHIFFIYVYFCVYTNAHV